MRNKPSIFLLVWASAASVFAQNTTDIQADRTNSAYSQDARGVIVRSSAGLCWRSSYWTAARSVAGCDGELVPPISNIIAPPIAPAIAETESTPSAKTTVPAPVKPCDFTVTLSNDEIFGFGKAVLNIAAEKHIDSAIAGKLKDCGRIDLITITGHTDHLGSVHYNQALSDRRAEVVAAYMKGRGISAQIDTFGAGKSQPIKICKEGGDRKKLIECLAPNRRVVIEVRGVAN